MAAVKEWLDTFGRGDLAAAFAAEGYDTLEGCSMMDWDEDLAGLEGMKKGFKKVLLAQIEALKVKLTPQPPPGQPSAGAASPASRGGKVAASAATAPQINADGSSIQTLEDGTVVQKNANGVVIELRKDGSKLQTNPDGSSIEVWTDGRKKQSNTNGTVIEVMPDGTKIQTAADGQKVEVRPDGTKITTLVDETAITTMPNGYRMQKNKDGTTHETKSDGTVIQTEGSVVLEVRVDGTRVQTNRDTGIEISTFADGQVTQKFPDGVLIMTHPDGRTVQRMTDGTVIETMSDGVTTQTCTDGSRIDLFPDGRQRVREADGTTFEILPNGQQTLPLENAGADATPGCMECTQCSTIISMPPRNHIAFGCPVCGWAIVAHQAVVIGVGALGAGNVAPVDRETEVRSVFSGYDADESGTIDKAELEKLLTDLHFPLSETEGLFEAADADQDGVLQWGEFVTYYNELQQKLLKSAVVADLRLTQKIIDAAKEAAAKDHSDVETEIASGGASSGGGPESAADRAKRLRQKADALKQISEDLATAEANLKESVEVARGVQHDHLAQKLAARKEKMSARGVTPA